MRAIAPFGATFILPPLSRRRKPGLVPGFFVPVIPALDLCKTSENGYSQWDTLAVHRQCADHVVVLRTPSAYSLSSRPFWRATCRT